MKKIENQIPGSICQHFCYVQVANSSKTDMSSGLKPKRLFLNMLDSVHLFMVVIALINYPIY